MAQQRPVSAPLITGLMLAALFFVYALELAGDGSALCQAYGFTPARPTLGSALTSLFLHDPSNWLHVGGNAAFLLVFGTVVERELGHARLAAIFLASGVAGAMMHAVVVPGATEPLVGASGCLFGLMAVAAVLRPRLLGFVASYAAIQIWSLLSGAGGPVSFGCHLGGFAAGFVTMMLFARPAGAARLARA